MNAEKLTKLKSALIVGHPGHELLVYGWMCETKPLVAVITDGSGNTGSGRLSSSDRVFLETGAKCSSIKGHFSDLELYRAILNQEISRFVQILEDLVYILKKEKVRLVVSDAVEGFSPTHDLCSEISNAAVQRLRAETEEEVFHCEFEIVAWERGIPPRSDNRLDLNLDDSTLGRKIAASRAYGELGKEVEMALGIRGANYFRVESFHVLNGPRPLDESFVPSYESWGDQKVSEGAYREIIRFKEHVLPIVRAIRAAAVTPECQTMPSQ